MNLCKHENTVSGSFEYKAQVGRSVTVDYEICTGCLQSKPDEGVGGWIDNPHAVRSYTRTLLDALEAEREKNKVLMQDCITCKQESSPWITINSDEDLPEDMKEYLWWCNKPEKEILLFGDKELFFEGGYNFTHYQPIELPIPDQKGQ